MRDMDFFSPFVLLMDLKYRKPMYSDSSLVLTTLLVGFHHISMNLIITHHLSISHSANALLFVILLHDHDGSQVSPCYSRDTALAEPGALGGHAEILICLLVDGDVICVSHMIYSNMSRYGLWERVIFVFLLLDLTISLPWVRKKKKKKGAAENFDTTGDPDPLCSIWAEKAGMVIWDGD